MTDIILTEVLPPETIERLAAQFAWRCSGCGHILAKTNAPPGLIIEIKCKCNTMNSYRVCALQG